MMKIRSLGPVVPLVFVLLVGHAFAQAAPRAAPAPKTAQTPAAPATPAPTAPAAAAATAAPRHEGQPINVRVELTISEDGGAAPPVKKTVSAVVGDTYMGFVREASLASNNNPANPDRVTAPLNFDALPTLLPNGKIRVQCTIQYAANQRLANERQINTDIKQNLTLILESGKPLVVSEATDPISDRKVTVEVKATILK
jgi:hypothetical protein